MTPRTRTTTVPATAGRVLAPDGSTWVNGVSVLETRTCNDHLGPGDHPLEVRILREPTYPDDLSKPFRVNGLNNNSAGVQGYQFQDFNVLRTGGAIPGTVIPPNDGLLRPSDTQLFTSLLAMTNPSRAHVDLPLFIYELKELPSLILKRGDSLSKDMANGRLSLEYGWKPFVSDLYAFLDVSKQIQNRIAELNQLATGGLKRKRKLWEGKQTLPTTWSTQSVHPMNHWLGVTQTIKSEIWGSVRWVANGDLPPPYSNEQYVLAMRAVLGLNLDAATVWNAIPFSWMVDWYANIGSYLDSQRNVVGVSYRNGFLMEHITYDSEVQIDWYPGPGDTHHLSGNKARVCHERKLRRLAPTPGVTARLPFLSDRQVIILSDLFRKQISYRQGRKKSGKLFF